jgi:hypothetical protein
MPRVNEKKKSRAGRDYHCTTCGRKIEPGENYYSWSFRYGGTHHACVDHYPKRSQLTQSLMGEVYAAIEAAETEIQNAESVADIQSCLEDVGQSAEDVAGQYREAAEHFGGEGENAERADELESWAQEVAYVDLPEPEEAEFDEDEVGLAVLQDDYAVDTVEELDAGQRMEWAGKLQEARDAAQEALDSCPL